MKLNLEEMMWGACFGLFFYPWVGLSSILLALICSVLWALSGAGYPKILRRGLVPLLASTLVLLKTGNQLVMLSVPLAFCVLSMGYGIPSQMPYDEGSALGRFWYRIVGERWANLTTRLTIILFLLLSYFPLFLPITFSIYG